VAARRAVQKPKAESRKPVFVGAAFGLRAAHVR